MTIFETLEHDIKIALYVYLKLVAQTDSMIFLYLSVMWAALIIVFT